MTTPRCEANLPQLRVVDYGFEPIRCHGWRGLRTLFDADGTPRYACPALGHLADVVRRFVAERPVGPTASSKSALRNDPDVAALVKAGAFREAAALVMAKAKRPVHLCPPGDSGVMPCCGRTPFEAMQDRMTLDPRHVTCGLVG